MRRFAAVILGLALTIPSFAACATEDAQIALPAPSASGAVSVEAAIAKRRSERELRSAPLTLGQLSQLLWAAQGVTDTRGYRTTPSAGALYPLTVYAVVESVPSLEPGALSIHAEWSRACRSWQKGCAAIADRRDVWPDLDD